MALDLGGAFRRIYFIGIGGVHMSGLAELCRGYGYNVAGSDARDGEVTERLRSMGIEVHIGHIAGNIDESIDLVVHTSAVKHDNPEMIRAKELNLLVIDRARLLGLVMGNYHFPVCVSGSHGKTSVTSMITEIMMYGKLDPTVMNGGVCPSIGASMRKGSMKYFIAEADEYYDAFLEYTPHIGVILNIDKDHTDYFPTFDRLWQSFRAYAGRIEADGVLVVHGNTPNLDALVKGLSCRVVTYGTPTSAWQARNIGFDSEGCPGFDIILGGKKMGSLKLSVPGRHNADNALAAAAACHLLGVDFDVISQALAVFKGAVRRFQRKGSFSGVAVIDDYAHHPTEIRATLAAAKNIRSGGRVWCVFQPHTRSRTKELFDDFAACFDNADKLLLLDIFTPSGREEGHIPVTSADLARALALRGKEALVPPSFADAASYLREHCVPGDMVITMGAGDVYKVGDMLL